MSYVTRQAAHCDQCSHEWLVVGASTPTHCAKCKSRRWNGGAVAQPDRAPAPRQDVGSSPTSRTKSDMQALRDICAGNLPNGAIGFAVYDRLDDPPIMEISICGKTWWEDGEQYECLMDKGHREAPAGKHGLRGMVRRLDA